MLDDHRVIAGADLDGGVSDRVATSGLPAPFLVISGDTAAGRAKFETGLTTLWPHLTGWPAGYGCATPAT